MNVTAPSASISADAVRYSIVLLSGLVVYVLMNYSLGLPRTKSKDSCSSFFKITDILPHVGVLTLKVWYSLPPAILFTVLANYSRPLVIAVIDQLIKDNAQAKTAFDQIHSTAPQLDSLILLIFLLALFTPVLKVIVVSVRDVLFNVAGLYDLIDDCCKDAADVILKSSHDYEAALSKIWQSGPRPPLPEELAAGSDVEKLSYQILWLVAGSQLTRAKGAREAVAVLLRRAGIKVRVAQPIDWPELDVWVSQLLAGGFVFTTLTGIYIIVIPELWHVIPVEWPFPDYRSDLAFYSVQRVLGYLIPVGVGIPMFYVRLRRNRRTDEDWNDLLFIMALIALLSLGVNAVFKTIEVARSISGSFNLGNTLDFFQEKNFIDVFLASLTPSIAIAAWYIMRSSGRFRRYYPLFISLTMGVWFSLSQLIYDVSAHVDQLVPKAGYCQTIHFPRDVILHCSTRLTGRFIHEFLFGAFLTAVFLLCSFIIHKGTRRWTKPEASSSALEFVV